MKKTTGSDYAMRKDIINFGKSMPVEMYGIVRANKKH